MVTHFASEYIDQHSNNSTTELPRAEVIFTGSTVSVRCVLSFSDNPRLFQTSMAFYLDGDHVGDYNVATSGGNSLAYDTLVYANNSLGLGRHNLTIVNGRADDQWYLMILDYIEYTAEVSDPPTPATSTESKSTPSKTKVLTGVLIAICLLFGIVLAYFIYRVYSSRSRRRIGQAQGDVELLPASPKQASHPTMWGWFRRYLNLNVSKRSISFNPTLLVAGRPRLRSESTKDLSGRHSPAIFEDEMDTHSKKPISEGRWAFIASWRDRAVREAEIPSLPPTSHAPTTVVSGPVLGHPENHTIQPLRIQSQQPETPGSQRPVRRGFTVMNT
ncbi:hypothetical protein NP233_g10888 [Leucocoprinus birnbaumii]|uniref:Uncharacterized protein n=1 Tax=Leucocoprinus birnbaumii TaxID=56174 RepID=A0AAD5YPF6_9AGAR|nr:hypothetical protein NP233_g10888 [Leucocoprinus birnbaumii]